MSTISNQSRLKTHTIILVISLVLLSGLGGFIAYQAISSSRTEGSSSKGLLNIFSSTSHTARDNIPHEYIMTLYGLGGYDEIDNLSSEQQRSLLRERVKKIDCETLKTCEYEAMKVYDNPQSCFFARPCPDFLHPQHNTNAKQALTETYKYPLYDIALKHPDYYTVHSLADYQTNNAKPSDGEYGRSDARSNAIHIQLDSAKSLEEQSSESPSESPLVKAEIVILNEDILKGEPDRYDCERKDCSDRVEKINENPESSGIQPDGSVHWDIRTFAEKDMVKAFGKEYYGVRMKKEYWHNKSTHYHYQYGIHHNGLVYQIEILVSRPTGDFDAVHSYTMKEIIGTIQEL